MGRDAVYGELIERWLGAFPLRHRVIACVSSQGLPAYLVGGTVRDAILGRQGTDMDIAMESGAMSMARRVANAIGGAYVPLDAERDVARVVVRLGRDRHHFDFARLRAESIEGDLWERDYTVNAMAVPLETGLRTLIDPTGGERDLAARLLRVVSRDAFRDDPLRILRGVRLRGELGFTVTADSEGLAREYAPELGRVSAERIRDELLRMLSLGDSVDSLAYAQALGALPVVLPELGGDDDLFRSSVRVVSRIEEFFGRPARGVAAVEPAQKPVVESTLGPYRRALALHWDQELSIGRPRWVALKLAALLTQLSGGPTAAHAVTARLRLSTAEARFVSAVIGAASQCLRSAWRGEPELVEIYRLYRRFGDAGVDGTVLSLAAWSPGAGTARSARGWGELLKSVRRLLSAWFDEHDTLVDPPRLLSGGELMETLAVAAGPRVGQLLELLREAQVQGLVRNRGQALDYLRLHATGSPDDEGNLHRRA